MPPFSSSWYFILLITSCSCSSVIVTSSYISGYSLVSFMAPLQTYTILNVCQSLTLFILFILLFHLDELNHTSGQPVPSILFLLANYIYISRAKYGSWYGVISQYTFVEWMNPKPAFSYCCFGYHQLNALISTHNV